MNRAQQTVASDWKWRLCSADAEMAVKNHHPTHHYNVAWTVAASAFVVHSGFYWISCFGLLSLETSL
jgi:hypothetical protein